MNQISTQDLKDSPILSITGLSKRYESGALALKDINLDVRSGEIFALLGPNGAGKTTLISTICGSTRGSSGRIKVGGNDVGRDYRRVRQMIGLVPQELYVESYERVIDVVRFSRALFGKPRDDAFLEKVLIELSLWEDRNKKILELSGGMKRRVMIAKALSHQPQLLFLDEPTAGVDVALRRDMWRLMQDLRTNGVTIVLTTHYVEEAEAMADRIGVINRGELVLVSEKDTLMKQLGRKTLSLSLVTPLSTVPPEFTDSNVVLRDDGRRMEYLFDTQDDSVETFSFLSKVHDVGIIYSDVNTSRSTLEDIFLTIVAGR